MSYNQQSTSNYYNTTPELQYFGSNNNNTNYDINDISGRMGSSTSSTTNDIYSDSNKNSTIDYDNEPPLLEELGIDFKLIFNRTISIIIPFKRLPAMSDESDSDLAGPLVICLLLGSCLLLSGKIHFGYIYGFGLLGSISMYVIINLLSHEYNNTWPISYDRTVSILGYGMVPIVLLSILTIFIQLNNNYIGLILSIICIIWSTSTATRMIEYAINVRQQRYLIAYPLGMVYACFTLLTIF